MTSYSSSTAILFSMAGVLVGASTVAYCKLFEKKSGASPTIPTISTKSNNKTESTPPPPPRSKSIAGWFKKMVNNQQVIDGISIAKD